MKRLLKYLLFGLPFCVKAQQVSPSVVNNAGNNLQAGAYSMVFSFGEFAIAGFTGGNIAVQSGFLQEVSNLSVLPVLFSSFTAVQISHDAQLSWQTAFEQNAAGFDLQRSVNGVDYATVSFITARNNAAGSSYGYTDKDVVAVGVAKLFYRLRQVDRDGKILLSPVVVLHISQAIVFTLFPNPVKDKLTFSTNYASSLHQIRLSVHNSQGQEINRTNITSDPFTINMTAWARGLYFLTISFDNGVFRRTILKE